jgi:excisionase family DNA binding protein
MDAYISTNEAADRLGITRQRVLQLIKGGRLPAEKFASVYMIRPADLKRVEDRPQGRPPKTPKVLRAEKAAKKGGKQ